MASETPLFLRSFNDDIGRRRRRGVLCMLSAFSGIKLLAFIVLGALVWLAFSHGTLEAIFGGGDSPTRISAMTSPIVILQFASIGAAFMTMGPTTLRTMEMYARALKGAVAARDERLTRVINVAPTASPALGPAAVGGAVIIGPLAHPMRTLGLRDTGYLLSVLAGCAAVCLSLVAVVVLLHPPSWMPRPIPLAYWVSQLTLPGVFILVGGAGVVLALVSWRYAHMERQDISATIDADGVTFTRGGASERRRLRWRDAHGLALISLTDVVGKLHEIFVLSGADEDFLWAAEYASPHASSNLPVESASRRLAAHLLVDQVIHHTGLPLLDLSQTVTAVAATTGPQPYTAGSLLLRAGAIARQQGDEDLAAECACRLHSSDLPSMVGPSRNTAAASAVKVLTAAQRESTLRLAGELLPYYPPFEQTPPNAGERRAMAVYWWGESVLMVMITVVAFAVSIIGIVVTL